MDPDNLNGLLHSMNVDRHYKAAVGDSVVIDLPRIPLTRQTEFVQLATEKSGDIDAFQEAYEVNWMEGVLSPDTIVGKAVKPGTIHFILKAIDSLTGDEMPEVDPIDIVVEIKNRTETRDNNGYLNIIDEL